MTALPGYVANVYVTAATSTAFTNEAFTDSGTHTVYTITNSAKRYWNVNTTLTVQTSPDGSTWTTVTTGFTVNYCGGIITFSTPVSGATPSVRATCAYFAYSALAGASSVEVTTQISVTDVSTFATGQWQANQASIASATYKLTRFWLDAFFLNNMNDLLVLSLTSGQNANQRIDAFGYFNQSDIKAATTGAITESLNFVTSGVPTGINS